ncbi:MAG TPA: hypothetical protein VGY48_28620 [Vicinamibacterales bacterium]|jgi:hypothetical protein|nr:hypothetical protein [Vicinamibacterales bacterium]
MAETVGSLARRAAVAACLSLAWVSSVFAQAPEQPVVAPAPPAPDFLSRADFHLSAASLSDNDIRFSWDTHFGGSVDIIDLVAARLGVAIDYEAVLGSEFRRFDPNQGNYTLETYVNARLAPQTEAGIVFHHVSRHLSDRPKREAVDWNLLGGRILHHAQAGAGSLDLDLEAGRIVENSYVDYSWVGALRALARRQLTARAGVYGRGEVEWFGVRPEIAGRGRQVGALFEAGVRLKGGGGQMELFAGVERRVDADPLDRQPQTWALAGFRLLSR